MGNKFRIFFLFCLCFVLLASFFFVVYENAQYPVYYKAEIIKSSHDNNLEPEVIASLIRVESSYRKSVVSNKGAIGLMQILPSTADWIAKKIELENFSEDMLYQPEINIKLGSYYIKYLIEKFGTLNEAVCAYNAGEGIVLGWLKNKDYSINGKTLNKIPYNETNNHLKKFNIALKKYKNKYKNFKLEKVVVN